MMNRSLKQICIITFLIAVLFASCKASFKDASQGSIIKPQYTAANITDSQELIKGPLLKHEFEGKDSLGFKSIAISEDIYEIPEWTFSKISALESVTLAPHTKKIGSNAFFSCKNLNAVNLGNVEIIGENAFKATALRVIDLTSVKEIGEFAFANCKSLRQIILSPKVKRIGDFAFNGDTLIKSCTIPNGIIGASAFMGCINLKKVDLKGQSTEVAEIGEAAFIGCKSLEYVSLPSHLSTIRSMTFMGCESLETIEIPASVQSIEQGAFSGCTNLKNVVFKSHNTKYNNDEFSSSVLIEYINN